jgi:hypothetical protein
MNCHLFLIGGGLFISYPERERRGPENWKSEIPHMEDKKVNL